jgi:hypothetical protein
VYIINVFCTEKTRQLTCLVLSKLGAVFFYSALESYINQIDVEQKFKVANIIVLNVNISTIKLSNFRN